VEMAAGHISNQYIAAQGPLASTCAEFWLMCWEQYSPVIVMLTNTTERGRVKCHQYWPEELETFQFKFPAKKSSPAFELHVSTISSKESFSLSRLAHQDLLVLQQISKGIAERELTISRIKVAGPGVSGFAVLTSHETQHEEYRKITQLQFMNWPDHGVPENSIDLINFIKHVKSLKDKRKSPRTVVHCSAGIGRTGVFITMETAMDLIDKRQSVYPLQILKSLRDQRAMLIQTIAQYQFVCEAILTYFQCQLLSITAPR
ncbi:Tyrosine-protein phosphatase non-receptor type 3, partial [Cichlidogyrus casuarinus]